MQFFPPSPRRENEISLISRWIHFSWIVRAGNLVARFSIRSCGFAIPSSAVHSPRTCTPARFIFAHVEEINDANGQPLSFSSPSSSPPVENPPAVSYLIHMRGPYACDRVADSEHGPRVPVPIQVASSASRRTPHSCSTFSSSSRIVAREFLFVHSPRYPLTNIIYFSSPERAGAPFIVFEGITDFYGQPVTRVFHYFRRFYRYSSSFCSIYLCTAVN